MGTAEKTDAEAGCEKIKKEDGSIRGVTINKVQYRALGTNAY